jgi:hypothetical protein
MNAGRLSVTTYLVPPITIVLSALLLREWPPTLAIAGGVVCLIGVGLTRRSAGPRHRSPDRIIRPEHDGSTGTGSPTNPRTRDRARRERASEDR